MNSSKQVKWGAILSYISITTNMIAGLLYTPWMIDQIGQSQYGLYTLAHSLITLFLVDFGLSSATARYVSKYRAENNQKKIDEFLGAVYKLYLMIDVVIFTVLSIVFICIDIIYVKLTPDELSVFKVVYVISALFSVFNFPFVTLTGILTSYEKFIQLKLSDVVYRLMIVGFTVIALLQGMGIYALVGVNVFAGLLITVYKLILVKKTTPVKVDFKHTDRNVYKEILTFSIWVTVSALAQRLIFSITPSILGIVASSSEIAVFGIVTTIEGYTYTITSAINGMFMPRISRIYSQQNSENNLMILMLKIGRFQYVLNGLIIVGFVSVGKDFISLWVGSEYKAAYVGILLVIIPGLFFNSLQIANTAMVVQKKVNIQAYIMVITGVVNVTLSPILSLYYGVIGACASIFVAYMLRAILSNVVFSKVLKLDILRFIKKCYIGMMPPIIIALLVGLGLNRIIDDVTWGTFMMKGFAVVVCYGLGVVVLGFSSEERRLLFKI